MRYLYVCGMNKKASKENPEYDQLFNLREFNQNTEHRFNHLFLPIRCLILDESLFFTFVLMKFKVRIITESEGCGIKMYVVIDAETSYVLIFIIFTGKDTVYISTTNVEDKEITWLFKSPCEHSKVSTVKYILMGSIHW